MFEKAKNEPGSAEGIDPQMEKLVGEIKNKQDELKMLEGDPRFTEEAKAGLRSQFEKELIDLNTKKLAILERMRIEALWKGPEITPTNENDKYALTSRLGASSPSKKGEERIRDFR